MKSFTLPDLGEGLAESEIIEWHVDVGDTVELDQVVVTVETAKAHRRRTGPIQRDYRQPSRQRRRYRQHRQPVVGN